MLLCRALYSGTNQCGRHRHLSWGSFCRIEFIALLAAALLCVEYSSALLQIPLIPKWSLPISPHRISPTTLPCTRSLLSRTNPLFALSRGRTLEDNKADWASVPLQLETETNLYEAVLSYRGDGSDDHEKNSTLPSRFFSRLPPFRIEDWNLLLYDIFLIVNLSVSISFWVVHRYDVTYIGRALNEGCLLSILWISAGLWNGSFLYSSVDGHYPPQSPPNRMTEPLLNRTNIAETNPGGPVAAGLLAFHTFINTINLRLLFALVVAVVEHRPALSSGTELLVPLELGYGLILMMLWRALHSSFVLR